MRHPSHTVPNTFGHNYATGVSYLYGICPRCSCPCNNNNNSTAQVPPYVGSDYYGQQCDGVEAPCCTHPNMPWFTKTLGETTTEDIQLRLCNDHGIGDEETLLQLIELYVY